MYIAQVSINLLSIFLILKESPDDYSLGKVVRVERGNC